MSNKNYKMAIVGYGGMGSYHTKLVEPVEGLTVTGAFDIKPDRMAAALEKGFTGYGSLDELLGDNEVDVVLIATPNDVHKDIAIQALRAGKHVICEKPVTITSSELLEIIAVQQETGQIFSVHQNRRWDEDFLLVKHVMEKRQIGDTFHIESRVQGANGIPGDWRQLKEPGGGMLLDWGVHLLDQLLLLTDSKVESVWTELSMILGTEVDDGFTSFIKFEDGLTALIEVGTTNYIKLPRWYVKGNEGTAIVRDWDLSGEIVCNNPDVVKVEPKPIQAGQGLTKTMAPPSEQSTLRLPLEKPPISAQSFYENFVSTLDGRTEQLVKNEEALRVLRLIETIFESAEKRTVINDLHL